MYLFKTKKKVGKKTVDVEEDEHDAADEPGADEELEEEEEEDSQLLGDETRDQEDERYLETLQISDENMRKVGGVPESSWIVARRAMRKVSTCCDF